MKIKYRSHKYDINRPGPDRDTNILNMKSVSVRWTLDVLSNTQATFKAQFIKMLRNIEDELKKDLYWCSHANFGQVLLTS